MKMAEVGGGAAPVVLLRHGESVWNRENLFTGWTDVGLTETGAEEARSAGRLMAEAGMAFDILHTSVLRRAIDTAHLALDAMDRHWIPVRRDWRLNERHYGALQGLDKKQTAALHGPEQVFAWRRSYDARPPELEPDDERHPRRDPRYASLPPGEIPAAECLADVVERMIPYWREAALPELRAGRRLLIAAHGNSIRALLKHLKGIPDQEISALNIPTGIPLALDLDENLDYRSDRYLGDAEAAEAAAAAVAAQAG